MGLVQTEDQEMDRSELERLRGENRRLAIALGAFSAFIASRGLLEEAWQYIHSVHQLEDGASE